MFFLNQFHIDNNNQNQYSNRNSDTNLIIALHSCGLYVFNSIPYTWLRTDISSDSAIEMACSIQRGINLVCTTTIAELKS